MTEEGKHEKAVAEFRKSIALNPYFAEAHTGVGDVFYDEHKLPDESQENHRAIQLDPRAANPHDNLGNVLDDEGNGDKAIADLRIDVALDPHSAVAQTNLGNVLRNEGDYGRATAYYDRAIRLNPNDASAAYNGRGLAYLQKGDDGRAIADFDRVIELNPNASEARNAVASPECRKAITPAAAPTLIGQPNSIPQTPMRIFPEALLTRGKATQAGPRPTSIEPPPASIVTFR